MSVNCKTKQYYSANYKEYISFTQNVDMTEHYNRFLPYLSHGSKILDIGFGSGRDMLYFSSKGYNVFGIDNVSEFVDNGKANGLNVELCDFHNLPYVEGLMEFGLVPLCCILTIYSLPLIIYTRR